MELTMLQNARLPPTVQSNLLIQLSGRIRSDTDRKKSYIIDKSKKEEFLKNIEEFNCELDSENSIFRHSVVEKLKQISEK